MKTDQLVARLASVRFPIRITLRNGRRYTIDRPAGISIRPRAVHIVQDGYDVMVDVADVGEIFGIREVLFE
jgi:hypothetical protein